MQIALDTRGESALVQSSKVVNVFCQIPVGSIYP